MLENTFPVRYIERLIGKEGIVADTLVDKLDAEAWIANRDGFGDFLNCILLRMKIQKCVFLSGNVHYSFTAKATFDNQDKTLRCWQMTSSALCNTSTIDEELIKAAQIDEPHHKSNWWAYDREQRWKTKIRYVTEESASGQRVTKQSNIGLVEFNDGKPKKHSLLNSHGTIVFLLNSE